MFLSVLKMDAELADVVLPVCGVVAQECANQIIYNSNNPKEKKEKCEGCEIGLQGDIF